MPDAKITALTAISTVDPTADPLVIVDVSDTSMAASGTTKKSTINQLLGAGGTATLASATITGDLTVDTSTLKVDSANNRVGIKQASPSHPLQIGTTDLILNSSGNLGLGVTPSAWGTSSTYFKALDIGQQACIAGLVSGQQVSVSLNAYYDGGWKYASTATASATQYYQTAGQHIWQTAGSAAPHTLGDSITFTQAMTLDASGNLLVGTTTNTNGSRIFARGTASISALAIQGASGDLALAQLTVGKFDNDTTTSQVFVRFTINNNTGGSGQINANGANQAAFGSFSDSRLKENIVSLPSQLANILSLRPVEFDYKDGSGHQIGFVAQEMQGVYSDAVGEQNGFLTVTGWSKTEARLVSAIQGLAAKIQTLEAKLA